MTEDKHDHTAAHEWLTVAEAARYLQVKPRTLLLWVRQRKVQAYALSGTKRRVWRFRRVELDQVLFAHPVIGFASPTVLSKERGTV
jgi:excisionase family DNA binding protein